MSRQLARFAGGALAVLLLALPAGVAHGASDEPRWKYFDAAPRLDGNDEDRRIVGCFPAGASPGFGCNRDERTTAAAAPAPWDVVGSSAPTGTPRGNNADTSISPLNPFSPATGRATGFAPSSPTREYVSPFANQWSTGGCNPASGAGLTPATGPDTFGGSNANDVNASIFSAFAAHNRLHDWSYGLGFTEAAFNLQEDNFGKGPGITGDGDPMLGDVQAGLQGGEASFAGRDEANQVTPPDGTPVLHTSHLWQPLASAYYPRCTDGAFDISLVAHGYAHAIANRMAAGPSAGLTSSADGQALAIAEGFADVAAVEYLHENGLAPADDEDPFTLGAYITGNAARGIRNYSMSNSPLNYSNVRGWDGSGAGGPHDDGEIWAAVNYDIRQALLAKYPSGDQAQCARGLVPAGSCPGNRRWMQLAFDALLLMPASPTMVQARDAYLAADVARFGGANQSELWTAFARRGLGEAAQSSGTNDPDPNPSFASPRRSDESTVTLSANAPGTELYIGDHQAGSTPVADTDPATALDGLVELLPGTYSFVARANGRGAQKFTRAIPSSSNVRLDLAMPPNRASGAATTGDGTNRAALVDDSEETNWEHIDPDSDVSGTAVVVPLSGGPQVVDRVNVSALLQGTDDGDDRDDADNQNRFTALRRFEIGTCLASVGNLGCTAAGAFDSAPYVSPADAFPGAAPRPVTPDLNLRGFDIPNRTASHVRLKVLTNQCTGVAVFSSNTVDNDPGTNSSCAQGNTSAPQRTDRTVRAAELQVFSNPVAVTVSSTPKGKPGPAPPSAGGGAGPATPAPSLSGLSIRPRRFRLGRRLPRSSAVRTGTVIRFRLNAPARVTYSFARAVAGRRVGRRCLRPTRARRGRPRCTRYVRGGTLRRPGKAGLNRLRFEGRLSRRRSLRPGRYRLRIAAVDATGRRTAVRTARFTLLPRRRAR